jgi:DNA polymerase-1
MLEPASPRLFLVDGYALIYRAFYALISRPLTTSRGENTSAVWGIANFLQRMIRKHRPEFVGWVHDSGLSFRHETYPAYKATREKLNEELQADFDTGLERVQQLLAAYHIPIITVRGYEADDVIGTLARKATEHPLNTVIISGDKDFQQLVRDGVWLLNPGRGGPAAVEEHWVSTANGGERLGVPPHRVTDYLALIGDSSDNIPGVKGIGEKTARQLITQYGDLESILSHAGEVTGKRPREALLANAETARLSKDLVTIREDLSILLDTDKLRLRPPDKRKLRDLFVEVEFLAMARELEEPVEPAELVASAPVSTSFQLVTNLKQLGELVASARRAGSIAFATETSQVVGDPDVVNPLRSVLVGISIAVSDDEAWYLPLAHRELQPAQGELEMFGDEPPPAAKAARKVKRASTATRSIAAAILEQG